MAKSGIQPEEKSRSDQEGRRMARSENPHRPSRRRPCERSGTASRLRAALCLALSLLSATSAIAAPFFGNGSKVGEVDSHSAIVWTRLTADAEARFTALPILSGALTLEQAKTFTGNMPVDVLPGAAGEVLLTYRPEGSPAAGARSSGWRPVDPERDYTVQIGITGLEPGTRYQYRLTARTSDKDTEKRTLEGRFSTSPAASEAAPIRFIVTTCQAVRSIDSGPLGHRTYLSMLRYKPDFFVHTGDIVYYDFVPVAQSLPEARAKWNLMFAYGHNRSFHQEVTSYFMKDDHDTLKDDCWPGQTYGNLTFDQGLAIFREQVPMGEHTFRTYRWGRDVQIWMTENRDFRSENTIGDGPEKTILGKGQLKWLQESIAASDATYKFLITPGPIVGPDKPRKKDNHANQAFNHEGQLLRDFLSRIENLIVITGDRHWQYHSVDPKTGLRELGCGPINDQHDMGGNPGHNPQYHQYFDPGGGYLAITVKDGQATAQWFTADLDGNGKPIVRHETEL